MVRVGEHVNIIVFHTSKVQLVQQCKGILEMDVVIGNTVHQKKANVLRDRRHIADCRAFVTVRIVLWGMHVAFGIDRVCYNHNKL